MPVGRKILDAGEALVGHGLHVRSRQRIPETESHIAGQGEGQIDADKGRPRAPRAAGPAWSLGDDVHQAAGGPGHGQVKGDGHQGQADGHAEQAAVAQPEARDEGQDLPVGQDPFAVLLGVFVLIAHGVTLAEKTADRLARGAGGGRGNENAAGAGVFPARGPAGVRRRRAANAAQRALADGETAGAQGSGAGGVTRGMSFGRRAGCAIREG